ncbi:hypothetical protein ACHAWF_018416 [Thalassiosira exigua]
MKSSTMLAPSPYLLPFLLSVLAMEGAIRPVEAFSGIQLATTAPPLPLPRRFPLPSEPMVARITLLNLNRNMEIRRAFTSKCRMAAKKKGDSIRDATGIRPSLHPTTINCVAEALLLRSQCVLGKKQNQNGENIAIDTADAESEPLQIAITAGGIALSAIDKRKEAAKTDETTDAFTTEETQTISGRVVGVVMRMRDLERTLMQRASSAKWVRKYGEEGSFGVLKKELEEPGADVEDVGPLKDEALEKELAETIKMNPLFRMNRAECLLATFLHTVESPKLEQLGEDVAGGSEVDFIDADRLEVLLHT